MRSRSTNILQGSILFSGIVYILIGIIFFITPLTFLQLFNENFNLNWLETYDLVAPLYFIMRGFAAILFTSGLAMILPLFDPLRYRGLIYYNGVLFPFLASIIFIINGIFPIFTRTQPDTEAAQSFFTILQNQGGSLILFIFAILFTVIFSLNLIGIIITMKQSKQGVE